MEIDRKTLKALSSDTRLDILKSLTDRRKMPAELSRELDLAASTIIEHLDKLEKSGLVVKRETGRKWVYYELTVKGENLIRPKAPVQFILLLSLGLILVIAGVSNASVTSQQQFSYPIVQVTQTITKTIQQQSLETGGESQVVGAPTMTENTTVNNTTDVTYVPAFMSVEIINWIAVTSIIIGSFLMGISIFGLVRKWKLR